MKRHGIIPILGPEPTISKTRTKTEIENGIMGLALVLLRTVEGSKLSRVQKHAALSIASLIVGTTALATE